MALRTFKQRTFAHRAAVQGKVLVTIVLAHCILNLGLQVQGQLVFSEDVFPPTCDGCFCVPDSAGTETCPSPMPPTVFNFTEQLKKMTWKNPIQLNCNPYPYAKQEGCTLTDSDGNNVEKDLGSDAVCGIRYLDVLKNQCYGSYTTESFATREEAEQAGYTVTHLGACGTCSSTLDLAIYIEVPDLQDKGRECGVLALSNETAAVECYEKVGFSKSCAATWLYDTINTRENCLSTCLNYLSAPPNLNQSQCPLNDCILCNEVISGPYFKQYAGRTRRGSGLLSYIIRNCSELTFDVTPLNPCPNGYVEGQEEDPAPVSSGKACFGTLLASFALIAVIQLLA